MCEFCTKHGDGEKWYLQAKNYSQDLLSDLQRRNIIEQLLGSTDYLERNYQRLLALQKAPSFIQRAVAGIATQKLKREHFGQVVPIDDIEKIFEFVNSIVRLPCVCREVTTGREVGFCYGVSMGPDGGEMGNIIRGLDDSYENGPDTSRLTEVPKQDALEAFADHENDGLCHTVWTFDTPFIGGICNCDQADCLAMFSMSQGVKTMFRAEYVAVMDPEKCVGCQECMRVCQFSALSYSAANEKVVIDPESCFGCGLCRTVCPNDAISLVPRENVDAAANLW